MNKQLADWIKSEEAKGYSEKQLRSYLLKRGYISGDIDDAIKSFGKKERFTSFSVKEIFKPTIFKFFFPVLIFILIFVSFFINSAHLPAFGNFSCDNMNKMEDSVKLNDQIREKSFENNANSQELINLYQQSEKNFREQSVVSRDFSTNHLKPLILGNLYFDVSGIYKLNPFFPTSCVVLTFGEGGYANTNSCRFYMSEESYNCIQDGVIKQNQDSEGNVKGLFLYSLPPFKQISFISLLTNSIIVIIILYLIISLISFGKIKLSEQKKKNKLIINCFLIVLPLLIFFLFNFSQWSFLFPLIVVFVISSFIKNNKHNKIFLYIMGVILILSLIGGIFVTNFIINKTLIGSTVGSLSVEKKGEYDVFFCDNTKILSLEEKQQFGLGEKYINEEWNVCDDPTCLDICDNSCSQKKSYNKQVEMLRGDNPSCICGC